MNRRRPGSLRDAVAVIAAAMLLVAIAGAAIPAHAGAAKKKAKAKPVAAPAGFCASTVVDNYREPLEKLQRIPAVPEGGVLPFAPAGMTVGATGPQGLLVGGSNIGFRLTNTATAATAVPRLNWTVLERLIRLTDNGRRPHPSGLKRINLGQLPAGKHRGLTFPITATPAIYSLEITIQNHRGRLLGRYGEYIRVVPRTVSTGITLSATDDVPPGALFESCFENHGTASVAPGAAGLERLDNGTWRPIVSPPRYLLAGPSTPRILGPGEAERVVTPLPTNALPGLYKLTVPGVTETGEPLAVSAEFGVL
jgi:hypothetical protein